MFVEDMYLGMKVVPIQRTVRDRVIAPTHSVVWRNAVASGQYYLVVNKLDMLNGIVLCGIADQSGGDYFMDFDLVVYSESS